MSESKLTFTYDQIAKKIERYFDKGVSVSPPLIRSTSYVLEDPMPSKFLKLDENCGGEEYTVWSVDCSTRTLAKTLNWGVYLLRVGYISVNNQERKIVNRHTEDFKTYVEGDSDYRSKFLESLRFDLESKIALGLIDNIQENDYLLLDGPSRFGGLGSRRFSKKIYDRCKARGNRLLAISKQTQILRDLQQRDLIARLCKMRPDSAWVYITSKKSKVHEHLYGDVTIVKLCPRSIYAFRCDIMDYLTNCGGETTKIISPLTSISNDPRCLGYPYSLFAAHEFSQLSTVELYFERKNLEKTLSTHDLLDLVRFEESSIGFADKIHRINYPFEKEGVGYV